MGIESNIKKVDLFLPQVKLKLRLKKVFVSGRSRMPDPENYYNHLANTFIEYFKEFKNTLFIEFYFDYLNTGSSKWLYLVLQNLQREQLKNGGLIEITWIYDSDDEAIQETGEVLKSQLSIPVILKAV
jgi:hypothetical protein